MPGIETNTHEKLKKKNFPLGKHFFHKDSGVY